MHEKVIMRGKELLYKHDKTNYKLTCYELTVNRSFYGCY